MSTVFVERDGSGSIKGVYANLQPGYAEESLADNDAEVISFIDNLIVKNINIAAMLARRREETLITAADATLPAQDRINALLTLIKEQ